VPVAAAAYFVLGQPAIQRLLIPPGSAARAVRARAFQWFAEGGLYRTRDHTGLLILVSALERRVVILGDSGLHERIGDQGWQTHVAALIARIREGRTVDGIVETIERIESTVAGAFPARPDDQNELSDSVLGD
jgi:putative membrane protein